jgi:hypothetical protein
MELTVFHIAVIYLTAGLIWGYALSPRDTNFHFSIKAEVLPGEKPALKPLLNLHPPTMAKNAGSVKGQAAEAKLQMAEFDRS